MLQSVDPGPSPRSRQYQPSGVCRASCRSGLALAKTPKMKQVKIEKTNKRPLDLANFIIQAGSLAEQSPHNCKCYNK